MGLDKPVIVQYGLFLKDAVRGDLGTSIVTGRTVATELLARLPATLELTLCAMLVAVIVGVPVGVISAVKPVKQYSLLDKFTAVLALAGISMPIFWSSTLSGTGCATPSTRAAGGRRAPRSPGGALPIVNIFCCFVVRDVIMYRSWTTDISKRGPARAQRPVRS